MSKRPTDLKYFNAETDPPYRGSTREAFGLALEQGGLFALPGEGPEGAAPGTIVTVYEYRRQNPGRVFKRRMLAQGREDLKSEMTGPVLIWMEGGELDLFRSRLLDLGWTKGE